MAFFSKEIESAASHVSLVGPAKAFTRYLFFFYSNPGLRVETQREEGETSPTLSKFPVTFPNNLGEIA